MRTNPLVFAITTVLFLGLSQQSAAADSPDDTAAQTLADRYSPVVRLQGIGSNCDSGEQFQPTDVNAVLGDQQVALRGPWRPPDLVKTQPEGADLGRGYPGHFLDFPGDPLRPGCDYAEWSAQIDSKHPATVYAHVVADPAYPGQLSLEYWFFYIFNDYNNTHEGDWESVQLVLDAATPTAALTTSPTAIGYSQHGGAERARWDDAKLEIVTARIRSFIPRPVRMPTSTGSVCTSVAARRVSAATTRPGRRRTQAAVAVRYFLVIAVLTIIVATIPLAVYYAASRAFAIPAVMAEQASSSAALRRSRLLVKRRWWRTTGPLAIIVGLYFDRAQSDPESPGSGDLAGPDHTYSRPGRS